MTLTEKAQRLWDWTVGELKEHGFEKVSVFQVRGQGLRTIDVVFSPGLNAWIARSPQGDSVTFEVRESQGGFALYQREESPDSGSPHYSECPKGNAVEIISKMIH